MKRIKFGCIYCIIHLFLGTAWLTGNIEYDIHNQQLNSTNKTEINLASQFFINNMPSS